MGRSGNTWGSNPDSFLPERWLIEGVADDEPEGDVSPSKTKGKLISKTPFEFPVFNGGPRACLGKKMAELQAAYVIAGLVQDFDFEEFTDWCGSVRKLAERVSKNSLTLPMERGLPCFVSVAGRSMK